MAGGTRRKDPTKCRSGKHEWTPENTFVKRGITQCRLCRREANLRVSRSQRAMAKTMTEAQLIERVNIPHYYESRIEKRADGCWMWRGCKDGAGYGYVSILHKPVSAHRIAYRLAKGDIPKGKEVCHSCDMPLCVNPDHLFIATHEENMRDMWDKGRHPGFPNAPKTF